MKSEDTREQPVIRCYNKPAIPNPVQARLTAEGMFVADYHSGWSLSSEQVSDEDHRPAAGNAFNRIIEISQVGGIGIIRTPNDDDQIIAAGEWKPNCATFREIEGTKLKGIQMSRYGLFTPSDEKYGDLDNVYANSGATVDSVKDSKSVIQEAIEYLEHQGRLRGPTQ